MNDHHLQAESRQTLRGTPSARGFFRCPQCRSPIEIAGGTERITCATCQTCIPIVDGIILLVRDHASIERTIEDARRSDRKDWYDAPHAEMWSGPYRHHLEKRMAYVAQVLGAYRQQVARPITLLDIGCGDGAHFHWLSEFADTLYGSDYNLSRLRRAAQHPSVSRVFMADVTDYPVVDDSVDVIFFNHVLEHIPDDMQALREAYRIVKPGGLAILGVPNEGAGFWRVAYALQPRTRVTSDHVHSYTADSIAQRCRAAGFRIRDVHPIGWGVPHWTLDAKLRQFRWVDDYFAWIGRRWLPSQATSLYLTLSK